VDWYATAAEREHDATADGAAAEDRTWESLTTGEPQLVQ
jgi:hypothetical protein